MNLKINNAYTASQFSLLQEIYQQPFNNGYTCDVTGNICQGDQIAFVEAVYIGDYPKAKFSHFNLITGLVLKDSYGEKKQQHTFTILTAENTQIMRKGRNIYKFLTLAIPRDNSERAAALAEKYERGEAARIEREQRKKFVSGTKRRYDLSDEDSFENRFFEDNYSEEDL